MSKSPKPQTKIPEIRIIQFLQNSLKYKIGCYVQKTYLRFTAGFPDLIVGYHGRVTFYEVKPWFDELRHLVKQVAPIQWATLKKMSDAGLKAYVLSVDLKTNRALVLDPKDQRPILWMYDFKSQWVKDPARLIEGPS